MLIPPNHVANATQGAVTLLTSPPTMLVPGIDRCDSIDHCRTVWNIIWSCLVTISLCIWVGIHPNVPQLHPPRDHWSQTLADTTVAFVDRLAIAFLALLAPEFIFVWALRQWLRARSIAQECQQAWDSPTAVNQRRRLREEIPLKDDEDLRDELLGDAFEFLPLLTESQLYADWKRLHYLKFHQKRQAEINCRVVSNMAVTTKWTTTHGFFILMGGFHQYDDDKPLAFLMPRDVYNLIAEGLLAPPSEEEIQDRSKSDPFAKSIVLVQTLWFVMQCIARRIEHLPITELEIATLAYTIPILGIYICWWYKPIGVSQPIRISKSLWDDASESKSLSLWDSSTNAFLGESHHDYAGNYPRVPRFYSGAPDIKIILTADTVASVVTILFGGIHCFAWSLNFPSETERLLWRIASLITTATPLVWAFLFVSMAMLLGPDGVIDSDQFGLVHGVIAAVLGAFGAIGIPAYLVARGMLLAVACTSLRSLPSAAYETVRWTTFIPHI